MQTNYTHQFPLVLSSALLGIMLFQWCYQTMAQLELPEAKPVESNEATSSNASDTLDFLLFEDPTLGYSISYPNDWEPNQMLSMV